MIYVCGQINLNFWTDFVADTFTDPKIKALICSSQDFDAWKLLYNYNIYEMECSKALCISQHATVLGDAIIID